MPDLIFREAQPTDAAALIEFLKQIGSESDNMLFGAEGLGISVEDETDLLEKALQSDRRIFLLAVDGDEIAACGSFSCNTRPRTAHWGEVGLSVRKAYWRQGIGSRLLSRLIDFAKNTAHAEMMTLHVRADNVPAIALYEKYGFVRTGVFPRMLRIGTQVYDSFQMVRML